MTVVDIAARKKCPGCGTKFVDESHNHSRTYCPTCRPPTGKAGQAQRERAKPKPADLGGEPFTLEHFLAWASQLYVTYDEPLLIEDWEADFIADVFRGIREGWLKEAWLIVPEGNGKSTLIAILILYCIEFHPEAAIPVAAAARDQANIIFRQAEGFKRRSGALGRVECKPGLREIVYDKVSFAKIFASDASTGDGIVPKPIEVIDELHRHKNLDLYRTWAGKLFKEDAVLIVISTAGEPGSDFEDVRSDMRQGAVESTVDGCFGRYIGPTSILHEYAVPEKGNVEDLELVKAANPSSRITAETLAAKRSMPSFSLPHWRRLTCNMPTRSVAAGVTEIEWARAKSEEFTALPAGQRVQLGLDVGWVHDTTAMVPMWVKDRDFRLLGPAVILEPPGDGTQLDAHEVERALLDIHERNPVDVVVMDMTKAEQLSQWITETIGAEVADRQQGNVMACLDYERFMEGLREGWMHHCGDDGLRQHVLNAISKLLPGGDTRFDRPKESRTVTPELRKRRVIDALAAACMVNTAVAAEFVEEETDEVSQWAWA